LEKENEERTDCRKGGHGFALKPKRDQMKGKKKRESTSRKESDVGGAIGREYFTAKHQGLVKATRLVSPNRSSPSSRGNRRPQWTMGDAGRSITILNGCATLIRKNAKADIG